MSALRKLVAACLTAGSGLSVSAIEFQKIADTATPIPNGPGLFKEFTGIPHLDSGRVLFAGEGTNSFKGLYLYDSGLSRVADITTTASGQQASFTAFSDNRLALQSPHREQSARRAAWHS